MFNKRQTAAFCSQLKLLLAAGLPLLEAISIIKGMPHSKRNYSGLNAIIDRLNAGLSFSEASSALLPALAIGSICAAEQAGDLEACLARLAGYYSDKADLDEKVAGVLIYPALIAILSFLSSLVLVIFVIPGLKNLLTDFDARLPPLTVFVLWLSDGFSGFWPALIILPPALAAVVIRLRGRHPLAAERMVLKTPLVSRLYAQGLIIQVFGTLGSLLKGGAPIMEALRVTANSSGSLVIKEVLLRAAEGVASGEKLSVMLEKSRHFPGAALQMLRIGENTGQLDQMLINIADFQAREREVFLRRSVALIEPALTLAVGLLVGVVVLAMFLPMVNMISALH
jgi:type IV pilus assembly protein PilC